MNLPTPSQIFNERESGLDTAIETVATVSMKIAAKQAKDVSGYSDIPVAIDGIWQKHGHTSWKGAVIATRFYTGKVLDASILSRFWKCPNIMHNENCKANHFGNSGSLELSGAIDIFQRSESLHDLRCTKFMGDGDVKAVNEIQLYGGTGIEKLECVGHVKKRAGTRIRALKLKMKGEVYKHKNTLPSEVLDYIKDVHRELSTPNLLAKCLHGFYIARAMGAADPERLRKVNYDILQNSKEAWVKRRHKKCILEDTLAEERKHQAMELACEKQDFPISQYELMCSETVLQLCKFGSSRPTSTEQLAKLADVRLACQTVQRRKVTSGRHDRHLLRMMINDSAASSRPLASCWSTAPYESRFNLWYHDIRIRVRHYAGECCLPECVIECHSGLTSGIMVWDVNSYHGRSNLLRIEGNLNSIMYVHEVFFLHLEVIPFLQCIPGALFHQDNARPLVVKTVPDFCSARHMQLLSWPAYSTDMSPSEHVRDLIGRRITRDSRPAVSIEELPVTSWALHI
ncbi:transposable element Tc1 transposase [Trichonephila clavipes]|nr:transposable element Tc1 transposase [Trichonephila clavipes]